MGQRTCSTLPHVTKCFLILIISTNLPPSPPTTADLTIALKETIDSKLPIAPDVNTFLRQAKAMQRKGIVSIFAFILPLLV